MYRGPYYRTKCNSSGKPTNFSERNWATCKPIRAGCTFGHPRDPVTPSKTAPLRATEYRVSLSTEELLTPWPEKGPPSTVRSALPWDKDLFTLRRSRLWARCNSGLARSGFLVTRAREGPCGQEAAPVCSQRSTVAGTHCTAPEGLADVRGTPSIDEHAVRAHSGNSEALGLVAKNFLNSFDDALEPALLGRGSGRRHRE